MSEAEDAWTNTVRDMDIARLSLADVPWGDMVLTVTVHVGEGVG